MHKKEQTADSLMQENKVQEIEFIAELRELEHELVTKQNQLEELELNKKRLQARVKISINVVLSRDFSHKNLNFTKVGPSYEMSGCSGRDALEPYFA